MAGFLPEGARAVGHTHRRNERPLTTHLDETHRDADFGVPDDGQLAYTEDTDTLWLRRAGIWMPLSVPAICQVTRSAGKSINNGAVTFMDYDAEDFDPLGWHDNVTNNTRVTPTIAGWYRVTTAVFVGEVDADWSRVQSEVRRNGTFIPNPRHIDDEVLASGVSLQPGLSATWPLVEMNGTTDYFEHTVFQTNTSAQAHTVHVRMLVELVYPT